MTYPDTRAGAVVSSSSCSLSAVSSDSANCLAISPGERGFEDTFFPFGAFGFLFAGDISIYLRQIAWGNDWISQKLNYRLETEKANIKYKKDTTDGVSVDKNKNNYKCHINSIHEKTILLKDYVW